jgi:hypothetical protein
MTNLKGSGHVAFLELQLQHLPGRAGGFWIDILAHYLRTTRQEQRQAHAKCRTCTFWLTD